MSSAPPIHHNRIAAIVSHLDDFQVRRLSRFSQDAGVSKATVSRLFRGRTCTSLFVAMRVQRLVNACLRRRLSLNELFSEDGHYPTRFVCQLVGCPGCLPETIFAGDGAIDPSWAHVRPGRWTGDTAEFREGATE